MTPALITSLVNYATLTAVLPKSGKFSGMHASAFISILKEYSVILTTSFYGTQMYESEDINKKKLISKISVDSNLRFQVVHDYVCFIAPINYCVKLSLVCTRVFCENCSHFILI